MNEKRGQFESLYWTSTVFSTNYEQNVYAKTGKGLQPDATYKSQLGLASCHANYIKNTALYCNFK